MHTLYNIRQFRDEDGELWTLSSEYRNFYLLGLTILPIVRDVNAADSLCFPGLKHHTHI